MKRVFVMFFSALLSLAIAAPARAAFVYYLHIDGIDGESTAKGYEKWINAESYSFGASSSGGSGSGTSKPKVEFQDFSFSKLLDTASPKIFEAVVTGKNIPSAQFDIVDNGGIEPLKRFSYSFSDVLFSSVQHSGAVPNQPMESATFSFAKLKLQSYLPSSQGPEKLGPMFEYDVKNAALVPEPSTWLTLMLGMAILAVCARSRTRQQRRAG